MRSNARRAFSSVIISTGKSAFSEQITHSEITIQVLTRGDDYAIGKENFPLTLFFGQLYATHFLTQRDERLVIFGNGFIKFFI